MIKRIIFIVEASFNLRDYCRFGIEILRHNQFEVEVWDITPALHPTIYVAYSPPDKIEDKGLRLFHDKTGLYNELARLKNDDFIINLVAYRTKTLGIYRALSVSKAGYAVPMINNLPYETGVRPRLSLEKIMGLFPPTLGKIFAIIFARTHFSLLGVKPARLILAGGERYRAANYPVYPETEVLWCHAFDYDLYSKERTVASAGPNKTIVFLDEYLPFHPDWHYYGTSFPMNTETYYGLLDKLFRIMEEELRMEVVIAAHPRSSYAEDNSYFKGRRCVRGQTCRLVKESAIVVSHASTSINFANLFYKPVLFVTSEGLDKCWEGPMIRSIAHWFGKKPVFLDGDISIDWQEEIKVDKGSYDNYRRAYIKRDSSADMDFWQIVADKLKNSI